MLDYAVVSRESRFVPLYDFEIHFRPLFLALGALLLLSLFVRACRERLLTWISLDLSADGLRRTRRILVYSSVAYFVVAGICKYAQFRSLQMAGQDFWLFEDLLYWMAQGEPYVTRFTNHAAGPVQHGSVHAFLTLWLLVPLVWIFGSTTVAILMNPVALALALGGFAIGEVSLRWLRSPILTLGLPLCFWMSDFVGRTLMYDTHPEAFYGALVVWAWFASVRVRESRDWRAWLSFVAGWVLLSGFKQDALVIGGSMWLALLVARQWNWRSGAVALASVVGLFLVQTLLLSMFRKGMIGAGPIQIAGYSVEKVMTSVGSGAMRGLRLESFKDVVSLWNLLIDERGGFLRRCGRSLGIWFRLRSFMFG